MICPRCWKDSKIYRSNHDATTNTVTRYHECLDRKCKHRFKTIEKVTGDVKPWGVAKKDK